MSDVTVSVKVDRATHEHMKLHDEINWSGVLRNAIGEKIEKLHPIDKKRAERAAKSMDALRKSGAFAHGRSGVEIIREWRDKRR